MLSPETFRDPPSCYRPIPFWFWNSKMTPDRIEAQIRDFHARGIGGFFIHARFGLETEYLGREWMDCVRRAIHVAEELGMEVWLYDENGFPSGIGDLKVSRIPEYRSKFIDLTEAEARGGESIDVPLPSDEVVLAYAFPAGNPAGERIDLAAHVGDGRLRWTAPQGQWSAAVYSRCVLEDPNDVVFGVDYLNPEAMRYFFDLTLDPYEKAIGEHFGKTVKGIFTDEPTLLPWHHDLCWYGNRSHTRVVVWDEAISTRMQRLCGLGVSAFLPHLFFDIDGSTPQVRQAFWQAVASLYVDAFFEPYRKWCESHNLKLTGHVLFEEGLYLNTDFQADVPELLSRMHIPGTDHLAKVTEIPYGGFGNTPHHLTNIQGQKLVTSIAHYTGKEAALSETYGCAGWGLSYERMKWIADWQYSLGINLLCPHAVFYSIEGFRKSDAPPSQNHMAGWEHYRKFADYIGRLSGMLRSGRHAANVALFYPLRRFWGLHAVGRAQDDAQDRILSDSFDLCASMLPRLHFDYDVLPEQTLASAEVSEGRLRVGQEEYEVLIAPPSAVQGKAYEVAEEFLRTGGAWIIPPTTSGEAAREQIERETALVRRSMGPEAAERIDRRIESDWPARPRHLVLERGPDGSVIAVLAGTQDPAGVARGLDGALREVITLDFEAISTAGEPLQDIRYLHRIDGADHIYFVINSSEQAVSAILSLEAVGAVEEWDPETGKTWPASGVGIRDGRLEIRRDFPPYGSTLYVVDTNREARARPHIDFIRKELLVFDDEWRFRPLAPNALILDEWTFRPKTHGSGEDYTYSTTFRCEHVPESLKLMLDDIEYRGSLMGGMDLVVRVNEHEWRRPEFGWHLDPGFKTLDIAEAAQEGENTVTLTIHHSAWSGQPHLLNSAPVLLGDFACDPETRTLLRPVEATRSGSWAEFGYPFYSGSASYIQSFRARADAGGGRMVVSVERAADMVEIRVNDQLADVRLWQPWEADVTDLVRDGHNVLELRVTNSMANFLEGSRRESGLTGRARLLLES